MAISSKSKLRDILEDERAVAIIEAYKPGFTQNPSLGPVLGMRIDRLLQFPQTALTEEQLEDIFAKLNALDA